MIMNRVDNFWSTQFYKWSNNNVKNTYYDRNGHDPTFNLNQNEMTLICFKIHFYNPRVGL